MTYKSNFIGLEGFIWWIGVVENRSDPLSLGRAQVRIYNWHTDDKNLMPTEDLPWSHPVLPLNNPSPLAPKEGDWVMGFFMDGPDAQHPIMMGVIPGIPETIPPIDKGYSDQRKPAQLVNAPRQPEKKEYSNTGTGITITESATAQRYPLANTLNQPVTPPIARNQNLEGSFVEERKANVVKDVPTSDPDLSWNEPETKYAAVYPYNKVTQTESGHIMEFDDTFGAERIQIAHRSGSFEEYYPDGSKVVKIVKDNYQIIMADDNVLVMGVCNITVNGKARLYIKSDYDVKVDGDLNYEVKGDININAEGKANVNSGENMKLVAPRIDFNP